MTDSRIIYTQNRSLEDQLKEILPEELRPIVDMRDSSSRFHATLPNTFPPETVFQAFGQEKQKNQVVWENVGLYYLTKNRPHEALAIFSALYTQMLEAQRLKSERSHKGVPLVWMHEAFRAMGYPVHAKRYLMLTLCEDSISEEAKISPDTSGVYFRLVWRHGLSDQQLKRYSEEVFSLWKEKPKECFFPEWILQEIDQDWMTEIPSPQEAGYFLTNKLYIEHLYSALGDRFGLALERLADYMLSCMAGCRTTRRERTHSTDYDIVCSLEGFDVDFRSELGRYFVCECKDWDKPADFTIIAKFCRVLDSTKARFGIIFSKKGISGKGSTEYAEREILKVFQDRGMVIVVIDEKDVEYVLNGGNFINLLRNKYKKVRLDLFR